MDSIIIKTTNPERRIHIDVGFDDSIWFHMTVAGGTAYMGLTVDQAKQLVSGVNTIIGYLES